MLTQLGMNFFFWLGSSRGTSFFAGAVVELQGHWPEVGINQLRWAVNPLQPVRQLIAVVHRGRDRASS